MLCSSCKNTFVGAGNLQAISRPEILLKRDIFLWILLNFSKTFKDTSKWLLLLIPSTFYPLITIFSFVLSFFFPFIIDNHNYGSLLRKGMKMKILLFFTIIYQKININIIKKICPGNNFPTHSKENTDHPRQKLR